jgi:hypothetical protein
MRPILLVGGAPRIMVDAVRYLSVAASGRTALRLREILSHHGHGEVDMLLASSAQPELHALRFETRIQLEEQLRRWVGLHPEGVVVMSVAVNDYELQSTQVMTGGIATTSTPEHKIPSGADEVVLRLRPASKVIDQLRPWGLRGPIIAFKYQERASVIAAAQALQKRVGAAMVFANSLEGDFQALVEAHRVREAANRDDGLRMLAQSMIEM